ncbi:MAG TPA: neocarzinostatin apoprotein domain-containing protein [Acidimicrobiales bacterium]
MDLDHEGTRAARSLHRQVAATIDLTEARAALDTAAGRHRRRRSQVIGATFAALVLVLGVVVAVTDHGSGTPHVRTTDKVGHKVGSNGLTTGGVNAQTSARGAAVLEAMPSGPIDGRDSWRLPVLAQPQAGLRDGQTVTMYGRGLPAKEAVGVVECAAEADTDGVDACQLEKDQNPFGAVQYAETTAAGTIIQPFVVHRYVDTPSTGKVDCQSAAERCLVAIGSINNYDDSGGSYINFAGAPPFPVPTMAITPAGPYAAGQQVTVQGRSLLVR